MGEVQYGRLFWAVRKENFRCSRGLWKEDGRYPGSAAYQKPDPFSGSCNERDYIEIGKKIYQKFKAGEVADFECISLCESIEKREEEAAQCQEEIRKIQEV